MNERERTDRQGMPPSQQFVDQKRQVRMTRIDQLPGDIRELVHEYGFHVVNTLMEAGVVKAKNISHVVETVLDEFSPTRGSFSQQGKRTEVE